MLLHLDLRCRQYNFCPLVFTYIDQKILNFIEKNIFLNDSHLFTFLNKILNMMSTQPEENIIYLH